MPKYRIIVEAWGKDKQEAIENAGHYMSIGYENRVLISVEEVKEEWNGRLFRKTNE